MKKGKIISAVLAVMMCMSALPATAYADFETKNGKTYYIDDAGNKVKGFLDIDDDTYYFDANGVMRKGWLKVNGSDYYYFNKSGIMVTGFKTIDEKKYYFDSDGKMITNKFIKSKNDTYYICSGGYAAKGLKTIDNKKYYFTESGKMHTGWKKIDGNSYYFSDNGEMLTNTTIKLNGTTYVLDKNGVGSVKKDNVTSTSTSNKQTETNDKYSSTTYILNTKTKKFHYSWCSAAKKISSDNYYTSKESRDELMADGYSPCKICKP